MNGAIGVIDIFAGPGGLGEGFSSFEPTTGSDRLPFNLGISAEMEGSAHATLRLRAFYRLLERREGAMPKPYREYLASVAAGKPEKPEEHFGRGYTKSLWAEAEMEAVNLTLGVSADDRELYAKIDRVKRAHDRMVLIGGPPCQAYSLVGRARQGNVNGFRTHGDHRHFLYRQYLGILAAFAPDVFIMENVKGILTSTVGGRNMFARIQRDLSRPSEAMAGELESRKGGQPEYVLLPIHVEAESARDPTAVAENPAGFVIRCEDHGVPQARHRVIIMGVRTDHLPKALSAPGLVYSQRQVSMHEALSDLPRLRSSLSRDVDDGIRWANAVDSQRTAVLRALGRSEPRVRATLESVRIKAKLPCGSIEYRSEPSRFSSLLRCKQQDYVLNHVTRGHMPADLGRYLFCAAFAMEHGRSPNSREFPVQLAPDHANWTTGDFRDRFRVQVRNKVSNTVTSHLSKDGHAFIHWDPSQCRSLSVREAARLQTFPDSYIFLGTRTQQYVQVGNAVPPLLARQIAKVVWSILV